MGNCNNHPAPPPSPSPAPTPRRSPPPARPSTPPPPPPAPTPRRSPPPARPSTPPRPPPPPRPPSSPGPTVVTQKPVCEKKDRREEEPRGRPPGQAAADEEYLVGEQGKGAEQEPEESAELKRVLLKYEPLIREADDPSASSLQDHIFSGIFLNQKRKKCWVDEKSRCFCFMLFARELSITWGKDHRYWQWLPLQETSDAGVEVARLLNVQWLEIHGKLEVSYLTPGATYQVSFVVMVEEDSQGWDVPVVLRLVGTGGDVQKRLERLADRPRGEWVELTAGEFVAGKGEVGFSMFEYEDGGWKRGLVVKGVCVRSRAMD